MYAFSLQLRAYPRPVRVLMHDATLQQPEQALRGSWERTYKMVQVDTDEPEPPKLS